MLRKHSITYTEVDVRALRRILRWLSRERNSLSTEAREEGRCTFHASSRCKCFMLACTLKIRAIRARTRTDRGKKKSSYQRKIKKNRAIRARTRTDRGKNRSKSPERGAERGASPIRLPFKIVAQSLKQSDVIRHLRITNLSSLREQVLLI